MIRRYLAKCDNCNGEFVLRVSVPNAEKSDFGFPCPLCSILLSGEFQVDYESLNDDISPSGFSFLSAVSAEELPVITISIDLPVHRSYHQRNLVEGGSPYLWLTQHMGPLFLEWLETMKFLHEFRLAFGAQLQKLINYASLNQWDRVRVILSAHFKQDLSDTEEVDIIYVFTRHLSSFYPPLIQYDEMVSLLDEYYQYLNDCFDNHQDRYKQLLIDYESQYGFAMFRKQVYGVYYRIIDNFDSFITGILYEKMSDEMKSELSQYRLYRKDFETVKTLYQDIFELNSKSMLYIGTVVNLSKRNDPCDFASGLRDCNKFRHKLTSFKKLEILDELPTLKAFFGKVSRLMRNNIGHFAADYDYTSGNIVFENGSEQNYIEFLSGFVWAVRSIWLLLVLIEKAEIDSRRLKVK